VVFEKKWPLGGERGASLIELMIAFSIFATSAMALFPLLVQIKTVSRGTDVRELCMQVVQGKLAQYKAGGAISSAEIVPLNQLSLPPGSVGSAHYGAFDYAKLRYNLKYKNGICDGKSSAQLITASGLPSSVMNPMSILGIRECVGNSEVLNTCRLNECKNLAVVGSYNGNCGCELEGENVPSQEASFRGNTCNSEPDQKIQSQLPGFKLYVKLERVSPWQLDEAALGGLQATGDFRFHPTCPNSRTGPFADEQTVGRTEVYDFDGVEDGIQVTVTGVIDITAIASLAATGNYAGISSQDPQRLMCSVSSVLTQNEPPIRYAMSISGLTALRSTSLSDFNARGILGNLTHFSSGTPNTAFAVHPLNLSVYLLGADYIDRYGVCGGIPLNCKQDGDLSTAQVLLDNGEVHPTLPAGSAKQVLQLESGGNSYQSLLIDFGEDSSPAIYVAGNSDGHIGRLEKIEFADDGTFALVSTSALTTPRLWSAFSGILNAEAGSAALQSVIFDPAGGSGFVYNLMQEYNGLYRADDLQRYYPVMRMQKQFKAVAR
jgi:type II secretory pathway pseudopilin PulG